MARQHVDRDSPVGLVFGNARVRLEGGQDDAKVLIFHERPGVAPRAPGLFMAKPVNFGREIEFEKRARHRRCVRTTVNGFQCSSFDHHHTSAAVRTIEPPSLSHRDTSIPSNAHDDA